MKFRITIVILILGFSVLFFLIFFKNNNENSQIISNDPNDYQIITINVGSEKILRFDFRLENTASITYIQEADRSKDVSYKLDSASKEKIQKIICDYCKVIERNKENYWPSSEEYPDMLFLWGVDLGNEDGSFSYRISGALCYPDDWDEFLESIEAYLK